MPLTNYCRKCKTEVPNGGTCPFCGNRLTKAGERLSFKRERHPIRDWFVWNAMLRIVVPVLGLVLLITVAVEAFAEGAAGVQAVFVQGFFGTLLCVLAALLLFTVALFLLQGRETVCCILTKMGISVYTYLEKPRPYRLYARLLTPKTAEFLAEETPDAHRDGYTLVHRAALKWADARRAQYWPETHTVLIYRPYWWQVICLRCSKSEYAEVETFVQGKVKPVKHRKKGKRQK